MRSMFFSGESDVNLIDFDENSLRQKLTDRQHGNDFIGEVEDSRKKLAQYIKLSLCQNDPLIGESFWQKDSLITHMSVCSVFSSQILHCTENNIVV